MNSYAKMDMMQHVLKDLEAFKETQTAIIKKIIRAEAYSVELGDTQLEMKLADIYESVSQNLEKIANTVSFYHLKVDQFAADNQLKLEAVE